MLFDTHAHYDDERFDEDRDALLASMPENNVGLILNPGCDAETSRKAVGYANRYPFVYAAVGHLTGENNLLPCARTLFLLPVIIQTDLSDGTDTRLALRERADGAGARAEAAGHSP